ncbi:MAG: hypothetical protein ACON49_06870 [Candidatus Puniceispirillaceae bacterium]
MTSGAYALSSKSEDIVPSSAQDNSDTYSEGHAVSSPFRHDPQYETYKDLIATPLRDFKVYDAFTLVDDWQSFMSYHDAYISGNWDDTRGQADWEIRNQGMDPNKCQVSLSNFTTEAAPDRWRNEYEKAAGKCLNILFGRFYDNPNTGITALADILLHWDEGKVLKTMNARQQDMPDNLVTDLTYAVMTTVGNFMAHYALYHNLYSFSDEQHAKIEAMLTDFVRDYDYYATFRQAGPYYEILCDLAAPLGKVIEKGTNDHCGSFNSRIATGATLYGLEFGNQLIYDFGVRKLEITLATIDELGGYSAHMGRGMLALGYAIQLVAPMEQLSYAFTKAFDFDLVKMKNHNGSSLEDYYLGLYRFAHDPVSFGDTYTLTDRRGGNFYEQIKIIRKRPKAYKNVWESFDLIDFYILGGSLAKKHFPKQAERYHLPGLEMRYAGCCINHSTQIMTSHVVGFNPYVLRDATGSWQ